MRSNTLLVPVLVVTLLFGFIFAMGILVLRSSLVTVEGSLELLRLHLEVARLHQVLGAQVQQGVTTDLEQLPSTDAAPVPDAPAADASPDPSAVSPLSARPFSGPPGPRWREPVAGEDAPDFVLVSPR